MAPEVDPHLMYCLCYGILQERFCFRWMHRMVREGEVALACFGQWVQAVVVNENVIIQVSGYMPCINRIT